MIYISLILSVLLGSAVVLLIKPKQTITNLLLAFSGAYLLSVSILHLLPEVYGTTNNYNRIGIFILVGIVFTFILYMSTKAKYSLNHYNKQMFGIKNNRIYKKLKESTN